MTGDAAQERRYVAAWQSLKGVGSRRIRRLVETFGSAEKAWQADNEQIAVIAGLSRKSAEKLTAARRAFDWERQERYLQRLNAKLVTFWDEDYPILLKPTFNAPAVLFYQGTLPSGGKSAALVGSRRATPYGLNAAQTIAGALARQDVLIVSGGARGIDTKAHIGALRVRGTTVVVTACGLDKTYPPENKRLFHSICDHGGAIITEFSFGMEPLAPNFPARNRIIAGLSRCVIVVEAAERSGALITSDFALEEGRDVFAVPGSIFSSQSRGTNQLLRHGAILLSCPEDVLKEYSWKEDEIQKDGEEKPVLDSELQQIWNSLMEDEALPVEEIIAKSGLSAAQVNAALLKLTLEDKAEELIPGLFIRRHTII